MATDLEFVEYVCDQVNDTGNVRYKKMFGEYMIYVNEKPILLVCSNTVFVKILPCLDGLCADCDKGFPYNSAKEHYILDVDNAEFLKQIINILEPITPLPKSRAKNASPKKRKPALPKSFIPEPPQEGDEYLRNGVFCFNISKMIDDIEHNRCKFILDQTDVSTWTFDKVECRLKEEYIEAADLSKPVIIAEIAPDRLGNNHQIPINDWRLRGYNLLDGHHRIEKASRMGILTLKAYVIPMESHIRYMYEGLDAYKQYWDEKSKASLRDTKGTK